MSIEVRQLLVKSNVREQRSLEEEEYLQNPDEIRQAILEECRRMILEALRDMKER